MRGTNFFLHFSVVSQKPLISCRLSLKSFKKIIFAEYLLYEHETTFFSIYHAMIISYNKEKNLVVWTEKLLLFYCSSDERISENSVHLQMLNAKIHTMYRV